MIPNTNLTQFPPDPITSTSAPPSEDSPLVLQNPRCLCCAHPQRYILERRISRELSTQSRSHAQKNSQANQDDFTVELAAEFIDDLALEFGVSEEEIFKHAELHMSVKPGQQSLEDRLNLNEATLSADALYEGMATLDHVGKLLRTQTEGTQLMRILSKELVDLYVGTHKAVQGHIAQLAALDAQLNGTKDNSSAGLDALTAVIAASQQAMLVGAEPTIETEDSAPI